MGGAIIGGVVGSGVYSPENITAADKNCTALENIKNKYGIKVTDDNKKAAECKILVLGVKPQYCHKQRLFNIF